MSIYTEWDPLEEVIVGDCPSTCLDIWNLPAETRRLLDIILSETKEDLDALANFITNFGVKVFRPNLISYPLDINQGNFNITNAMSPLVPRDQYLVYGNTIVQTYTSMPSRYVDSLSYYDIFLTKFLKGFNWISQPPPVLKNLDLEKKWQVDMDQIYGKDYKYKILWHTATILKCGDALIVNDKGPGTELGLRWMEQNLSSRYIYNKNVINNSRGHIDHGFFLIDDNTVCCSEMSWVPEVLRTKEVIEFKGHYTPYDYTTIIDKTYKKRNEMSYEWLDEWLSEWKGYAQDMACEFNVLVIDPKNVIFSADLPGVFEILEKRGVRCHVCRMRHAAFWEAGIHCLTLDIKRNGANRTII